MMYIFLDYQEKLGEKCQGFNSNSVFLIVSMNKINFIVTIIYICGIRLISFQWIYYQILDFASS